MGAVVCCRWGEMGQRGTEKNMSCAVGTVREADLVITGDRMGENFADTTQPPPVTTDETRQLLRKHSIGQF